MFQLFLTEKLNLLSLCLKQELRGETWTFNEKAITFQNGKLIGGPNDFINWAIQNFNYEEYRPKPLLHTLTEEAYKATLNNKNVSLI